MKGLHELDSIIRLVEPIASVSVCIACLELLARPGTIDDCGLMNWPTAKLRFRWFATGPIAGLLDVLLSYPTILIIITARLLAAATLLTGLPHGALRTVLATVVATVSIAMGLRSPYGQDGADQMTLLTFGGLALVHVSGGVAGRTFLWFMAAQTCLSYATAGLAKLGSAGWRDGSHLIRIFNTQIYGHARLAT
jgi:hypothetical protein